MIIVCMQNLAVQLLVYVPLRCSGLENGCYSSVVYRQIDT